MLTAETRTRDAAEPSGEPETLWGRMAGKMGDRVQFGKPTDERKTKKQKYAGDLGGVPVSQQHTVWIVQWDTSVCIRIRVFVYVW